jgi:branched-chain amino acid transport system substrate-binding protein
MAVMALGIAACGGGNDEGGGGGEAKLDLTIGNLVPLTGDLAPYGAAGEKAGELAGKQIDAAINKTGGDDTVKVISEDGQSEDQGGVQAARKLIADGATCISGDYASTATVAVARSVTIPEEVLLISPASTADALSELDDEGLFDRTAPPDGLQGKALADRMEKELGTLKGKKINIGARNDLYGTGFADSLQKELEERGAQVPEKVIYDPEQPSYNSEAQQITSGNPDGWVIIDFPETYAKVGPALVRTGNWDPKKSFITDGLASSKLPGDVGRDATEGMRGTAPGSPDSGQASEAFDKAYTAAGGPDRQTFDAQNFDAVILCYLAAVAAGSTDGKDMAAELQNVSGPGGDKYTFEQLPDAIKALQNGDDIDYEGASGPLDLNDDGDPTSGVYDIYRYKDGKLEVFDELPVEEPQA